jgi:hypothetical protein
MIQYPILMYVSLFSAAIPILAGIYGLGSIDRGMKILFYYLIAAFAADIFLMWFVRGHQLLHVGLVHAYYLVEYLFIMSIISVWQESHWMKRLFHSLLLLYILFWIVAKVTFEPLTGLYSLTASVSQVILVLSAGYTLFVVIGNRVQPLMNHQRFWILLSFVIYYAGTLMIIALRGILIQYSKEVLFVASSLDWSLKILFNILFTIGFLCPQTQP